MVQCALFKLGICLCLWLSPCLSKKELLNLKTVHRWLCEEDAARGEEKGPSLLEVKFIKVLEAQTHQRTVASGICIS